MGIDLQRLQHPMTDMLDLKEQTVCTHWQIDLHTQMLGTDAAHVIGLYVQPEPCLGRRLKAFNHFPGQMFYVCDVCIIYIIPHKYCNMID